jgi:hypothetical protein
MVACTSCDVTTKVLSARGFTHVPKNLPANLITLDLSDNNITTIENDDFGTLKQVKTINLSYNQIQTLHGRSFENLPYLEVLDISFNNIVHLPHLIFIKNHNLKDLYLKKNKLNITGNLSKAEHILDSQSLVHLDISFCNITFISCEALKGLPNLMTLNTDGNKAMKADFCNSSTFNRSCCDLQGEEMETDPSTPRILPNEANRKHGPDSLVVFVGVAMCICVFIIVVTSYFLYNYCARRRAKKEVDNLNSRSADEIQRRPLPQLPNGGYEEPILPSNESNSSVSSSSLHSNRNFGYVPLTSEENESLINTDPATYHVSMETIHASVHSLSGSTNYQAYAPTTMYPYSDSDVNEEEDNNFPGPPMKGKCFIPTSPHFSGANHPSTTGIPPRLGYPQDPTRPTPTSPTSPTGNVTKFFVKKVNSEKVYISSTSIELGQNSSQTVEL